MAETTTLASRFRVEFIGQIVAAISGAALIVVLARILDPDNYGLLFLGMSVFGILMVLTKLGIGRSAGRYISEYKETNPSQISHIIWTSLLLNLGTIAVVGIGLLAGYQIIAELLNEPDLAPFLQMGVLYLIFGTLTKYVRQVLQGFEAIKSAALIHIVNRGGRALFAIGLVLLGYGAFGALSGYIISYLLATVAGLALIFNRIYREYQTTTPIESGLQRRIAEYTIPLTATSAANALNERVDTVLVGFFLTPVAVSYYVISKQVVDFVEKPMVALGFTLAPTFGSEKANENIEHARKLYETALVNSLLLYIPTAAGLILVAEPMIELVFGTNYVGAASVLQVLSAYAVFQAITNITSHGLDFMGRARDRAIAQGITSALNVLLNILLIPMMGVVGAAISTLITYGIYTIINVFIIHLEFNLRIVYLLKQLALIGGIAIVMSGVVFILLEYITGWITLGAVVGIGVFIWAALAVLTGLMEPRRILAVLA